KTKMAPSFPEEVDVFTIPHSRMKELVNGYCQMMTQTDFSNVVNFELLLKSLIKTFTEFKSHEKIENEFIMQRLKTKLRALQIHNTAVCNCHKDNKLVEVLEIVRDGFDWKNKTPNDRWYYGDKLRRVLQDFTENFLPHMKEEEEVFQPLLMKYFTVEELKELKEAVVQAHSWNEVKYSSEEKLVIPDDDLLQRNEVADAHCEETSKTSILDLPNEVTVEIFSFLNPKEKISCREVCHQWSELALDASLWKMFPVQWALGNWDYCGSMDDIPSEEEYDSEDSDNYVVIDEDKDEDTTSDSDSNSYYSNTAIQIRKEAKMLSGISRYLLPMVGFGVETLDLAGSRGITNSVMNKMLKRCPNVEHVDCSQTRVGDSAFKGLAKHRCGKKLKTLNLSGCTNISDIAMLRLAEAMHYIDTSEDYNHSDKETSSKQHKETPDANEEFCYCDRLNRLTLQGDQNTDNTTVPNDGNQGIDSHYANHTETQAGNESPIGCCDYKNLRESSSYKLKCKPRDSVKDKNHPNAVKNCGTQCHEGCDKTQSNSSINIEDCTTLYKSNPKDNGYSVEQVLLRPTGKSKATKDLCNNRHIDRRWVCTLEKLNVSGCFLVSDVGLRAIGSHTLPKLTLVDLSGCLGVTAKGLFHLVKRCPNLPAETLFYCDNIEDGRAINSSYYSYIYQS
ncbi:unnamed protein product, partial [Owenia fusiformis]